MLIDDQYKYRQCSRQGLGRTHGAPRTAAIQCWKQPVARWPDAPNFCLGPPEISKLWTLVAQLYLSGNSK